MSSVRSGAVLLAIAAVVAGCANGHIAAQTVASPHPTASAPPVSVRMVLPSRTMTAGSQMTAHVVVSNNTGHAIREEGCGSLFQVALTSSTYHPDVGWLTCLQLLTIPAGKTSYAMKVQATYLSCSQGHARAGLKACLPGKQKMPPLPPGHYKAKLFTQVRRLAAAPRAIPVRVTTH
ncbi:MAG: hypothetical protein ACTHJW_00255 [Streptosporangiaceae bacterium]